jgi:hypothetical protein
MGNTPQLGLFPFLRSKLGEYFPELTRYTMPWYITSGPWNFKGMPFNMDAYNFILGKRFNYGDDLSYLSSILPFIKIYDSAKDAFYYGRFMDNVGLTLQQPIGSNVVGKVHIGENSTVIALWNNGNEISSMKVMLNLSILNLTKEVGTVIDLGVTTGFRDGCASLPFNRKDNILEFEVFNLAPQNATAIQILSTKPKEGVLEIQSLNLSRSEISKGENLAINLSVEDSLTQNVISEVNVIAFIDGLTIQGYEISNGKYRVIVDTEKFGAGTIRAVIVVEKEGYTSDFKEVFFTLKEPPPTFPFHFLAVILVITTILVWFSRYYIKTRKKQFYKAS